MTCHDLMTCQHSYITLLQMFSITYFICSAYSTVHQQLLTDDPAVYTNMAVSLCPFCSMWPLGVFDRKKSVCSNIHSFCLIKRPWATRQTQANGSHGDYCNQLSFQNKIWFFFMLLFLCTSAPDDQTWGDDHTWGDHLRPHQPLWWLCRVSCTLRPHQPFW